MLVASSFVPTPASNESQVSGTSVIHTEMPISTTISIQNPVKSIKITQGYKFFHPGLDLDGNTGDQIKAIKAGKVESAESESFGYGKHVIVDHGEDMKTLYAHLSEIKVKKGDTVDTSTIIGLMGSTGHSTGSHLHFEVRQNGIPVNPLSILPK
jgi:murein DD-endopeptidase MepM/ murein hydrolase activator NlpD